LSATQSGH
jgi:hypothetical protein